jgi:RNA polymerase sigma-70 factor (ECF subfamily)
VDAGRFERAWAAHAASVLRYSTYATGSSETGEDVAAETFARFLAKGSRVAEENVEAWLIRVARNLCSNHRRAAASRSSLEERLARESQVVSDTAMASEQWTRPDSWEYVRRLNPNERLAVYLRVAEDRSFADIARLLGKSESAAKMTFYRAIDRLRREMHRDGAGTTASLEGGADCV